MAKIVKYHYEFRLRRPGEEGVLCSHVIGSDIVDAIAQIINRFNGEFDVKRDLCLIERTAYCEENYVKEQEED